MAKELVSVGLFLAITVASFYGLTVLWSRLGRAGRAAAVVGTGAAYCVLTYLISLWAARGGWPEGMFYMMAALFVGVPAVIGFAVLLIIALFGGTGSPGRRAGMITSFVVLGALLLALVFNKYLRLAWYERDLDNPDPGRRGYAVLMLGETRLTAAEPMVRAALNDPNPSVRKDAVLALGTIDDPDTAAAVRGALSDEDAAVREAAAIVIVPLGRGGPEVVSDLKGVLSDPDPRVRGAAEMGLDTLDPSWRTAADIPETYRKP
jgi:hypothetical protein